MMDGLCGSFQITFNSMSKLNLLIGKFKEKVKIFIFLEKFYSNFIHILLYLLFQQLNLILQINLLKIDNISSLNSYKIYA